MQGAEQQTGDDHRDRTGPNFQVAHRNRQLVAEIVDIALGGDVVVYRVIDFRRNPLGIGALHAGILKSANQHQPAEPTLYM